MTDWISWLKRVRYAKRSRGKAPIAGLRRAAKSAGVKLPKSELALAESIGALRQLEYVLPDRVAGNAYQSLFQPERDVTLTRYDHEVTFEGKPLRGIVCSFRGHLPHLIGTDALPTGWGWLLNEDGYRGPTLFPVATNVEDVALLTWTGLLRTLTSGASQYSLDRLRRWKPEDAEERELVLHCLQRLRECADLFRDAPIRSEGNPLVDGCAIVVKGIARVEKALGVKKTRRTTEPSWPDSHVTHEDELAELVCEAYPAGKYTMKSLRRLLQRGHRHRKPKKLSFAPGVPKLLRDFVAECKTVKRGLVLQPGIPFTTEDEELEGGPWFVVFAIGNGDFWVCDRARSSVAHYVDHEGGTHFIDSTGLALGSLLAAWLFNDEVTARGLADHPDCEARAHELCPVEGSWSVFPDTF